MQYIKTVYFHWYMCWLIIHQNDEKHLIQSVLKLNLIKVPASHTFQYYLLAAISVSILVSNIFFKCYMST